MGDDERELYPEELIAAFERCGNYPRDKFGAQYLAQGLRKASDQTGIPMQAIVDRCLAVSEKCPTDHDLAMAAHAIKTDREVRAPQIDKPTWTSSGCPVCSGTGYKPMFALETTIRDPEANYVKREWVTESQYKDLYPKIDWQTQALYECVKRCECQMAEVRK